MDCTSPPELDDRKLLAYLDGVVDPQVVHHLEGCPACRERAEQLERQQKKLTAQLYRLACPEPVELGDYHLGLLPSGRALVVAVHLRECPHCTGEVSQLKDFLSELAPLPASPVKGMKVLVARLLGVKDVGSSPGLPARSPAFIPLRGDAPAPITLEVDGVLILLDVQPAAAGRLAVLGQVASEDQDDWTGAAVELRSGGALQAAAAVDDLGAFRLEGISPGLGELKIISSSGPVIVVEIEVEADE